MDENTDHSDIMLFHPIPALHLLLASREQNSMDGGPGAHKSTDKGKRDESKTVSLRLPLFPGSSRKKAQRPCRLGEMSSFWSSFFFPSSSSLTFSHSPTLSLYPLGLLGQEKLILLTTTF